MNAQIVLILTVLCALANLTHSVLLITDNAGHAFSSESTQPGIRTQLAQLAKLLSLGLTPNISLEGVS